MDHGSTKRIQDYVRQWPFLHDAAMHMARYGYLFYFLFGIVQWMRPGTYAEKTKRQRALLEAILWHTGISIPLFPIRIIRLFPVITL